jgi:hypothetical protein
LKTLAIAFALLYFATIFIAQDAFSATKAKAPAKKLSTSVDFGDRTVGGKYVYTTESITTVENDKSLDDLIGVRKNFKDRIERSESLR